MLNSGDVSHKGRPLLNTKMITSTCTDGIMAIFANAKKSDAYILNNMLNSYYCSRNGQLAKCR